jgi:hypothetical protein
VYSGLSLRILVNLHTAFSIFSILKCFLNISFTGCLRKFVQFYHQEFENSDYKHKNILGTMVFALPTYRTPLVHTGKKTRRHLLATIARFRPTNK